MGKTKKIINTETWINFVKKVHGDRYDYSKSIFNGAHKGITITCPIHGDFIQKANNHKYGRGCYRCSGRYKLHYSDFLKRCNEKVDMNKYKIIDSSFKNSEEKIDVICDIHGVFSIAPHHFLNGRGCAKCAIKTISIKNILNSSGWSINSWDKSAKKSKNFDSFKVYIIRCWNDSEEFYKIGRTYRKTGVRFGTKKDMPYNYEVLEEIIFDNARDCFNKEAELKRLHKEYSYLPNINFAGKHECYKKIDYKFGSSEYCDYF